MDKVSCSSFKPERDVHATPISETCLRLGLRTPATVHASEVLPLSFMPIDGAQAGTVVHVIETWPSGEHITLGKHQNFYLRLRYETDKPVHM